MPPLTSFSISCRGLWQTVQLLRRIGRTSFQYVGGVVCADEVAEISKVISTGNHGERGGSPTRFVDSAPGSDRVLVKRWLWLNMIPFCRARCRCGIGGWWSVLPSNGGDAAVQGAAGGGIHFARDSPREVGQSPGIGGVAHGPGHPHRILCVSNSCVK